MSRRSRLAGALAVALAAAGCGSSSLSPAQLRSAASQACALARQRTDQIPTPATPAGGATFLSRGISALVPEQSTLQGLHPPRALAADYDAAVRASADELQALRLTLSDLRAGDDPVTAIKALQKRLSPLERRSDAAWHALGVPGCAVR